MKQFSFSVLHALAGWLRQDHPRFLWFSGAAILIFRAELGIYLGQLLLLEIVTKRLSFTRLLKHGVPAGIVLLGMDFFIPFITLKSNFLYVS